MDWKRKLTSRKFWMAVVAFVTPLLLAFGMAESEVTQITAIIMAGADVLLSDNYFDMDAGTRTVKILRGNPDSVSVRSVYDIR